MEVINVEKTKVYTLKLTEKEIHIVTDLMYAINNKKIDELNDEELELYDRFIKILNIDKI
jgi:uncharacterized protein YpuA (DUF1002 family)